MAQWNRSGIAEKEKGIVGTQQTTGDDDGTSKRFLAQKENIAYGSEDNIHEFTCGPCHRKDKKKNAALFFCRTCEEPLCDRCMASHNSQKHSYNHNVILLCEPCLKSKQTKEALCFCKDCDDPEAFCEHCARDHNAIKSSENHKLSYDLSLYIKRSQTVKHTQDYGEHSGKLLCGGKCESKNKYQHATFVCNHCNNYYCNECTKSHERLYSDHEIKNIAEHAHTSDMCKPCSLRKNTVHSTINCPTCNDPLRQESSDQHLCQNQINSPSVSHQRNECLVDSQTNETIGGKETPLQSGKTTTGLDESITTTNQDIYSRTATRFESETRATDRQEKSHPITSKPYSEEIMSNSVVLKWPVAATLKECQKFEIMFKEMPNGKWKPYETDERCTVQELLIEGLKADTSYRFKVKVVDEYSGDDQFVTAESDDITTLWSPTIVIVKNSQLLKNGPPAVYKVPVKEDITRNTRSIIQKYVLGSEGSSSEKKSVLLVGATGSGKSTLINAMVNYLLGVTWKDPFRFRLVDVESLEEKRKHTQAQSQTECVTCYMVHNDVSSHVNFSVTLIDTPGFGDTRGPKRDEHTAQQISSLFETDDGKRVTSVDAVCFVLKAPDARLTPAQLCIFDSILKLFGNDIVENICTLITFADNNRPPVLNAIEGASNCPLSTKTYFRFNNSALYADNTKQDSNRLFWQMGMESCKEFFKHLLNLRGKSFGNTCDIIMTRTVLDVTIENIKKELKFDMDKVIAREKEIQYLRQNLNFMSKIKTCKYKRVYCSIQHEKMSKYLSTICRSCRYTCHENCQCRPNLCVCFQKGQCTQCPNGCKEETHKRCSELYIPTVTHELKTAEEVKNEYEKNLQKKFGFQDVIDLMENDVLTYTDKAEVEIEVMKLKAEELNKSALRSNVFDTPLYIEELIDIEKREKRNGYEDRLRFLKTCRDKLVEQHPVHVYDRNIKKKCLQNKLHITLSALKGKQ